MPKPVSEPKTSAVRDVLTKEIIGAGLPVIAIFDFMDASALIHVKSEDDVFVGYAYGEEFINGQPAKPYSLKDIDVEGLFHLYHDGVRPGHKDWDDTLQASVDEQKEMAEDDGDDGE